MVLKIIILHKNCLEKTCKMVKEFLAILKILNY